MSETKFKIGDKVKRREDLIFEASWDKDCERINLNPRDIFVIEIIDSNGGLIFEKNPYKENFGWHSSSFELVKEPEETPKPKFKVGDKVRAIKKYDGEIPNGIGTIKYSNNGGISVEFLYWNNGHDGTDGSCKNPHGWSYTDMSCLELITETAEDKKLIKTEKMDKEKLKEFDKQALTDAKTEILKERAEIQKEKAKTILRQIYEKKDEAEEIVKETNKQLKELDDDLKVFDVKVKK